MYNRLMTETILHQWFRRVWNEGDRNAAYELLAPDAIVQAAHSGPPAVLIYVMNPWDRRLARLRLRPTSM
jgi:hypothetical protein